MALMTRDQFREAVFARDRHRCVICRAPGQDAHHIIERRLFDDGGYYLNNGATLCGPCHFKAETTVLEADAIRWACGIRHSLIPEHFYPDERYDKWGNVILPNGRRLKGELFDDTSVQKVLAPVLHLFTNRVKYPRTMHLPWSASVNPDDRVLSTDTVMAWDGTEVIITEKMDGENTTMYTDGIHARSIDYSSHVSRSYVRQLHATICGDIPADMRICGENLWAQHSIAYLNLPSYFMVFSIWIGTRCLSWRDTVEWCALLGLHTVPVLHRGTFRWPRDKNPAVTVDPAKCEGYVIRPTAEFTLRDFPVCVGKYVRRNHVQTHGHWMRSQFTPNRLALK